jgi:hypothetical protein
MDALVGPDGQPSRFDGAAYVSSDGRYWWNGAAWQPIRSRRSPNFFVMGLGLVIIAAVGLVLFGVIKPGAWAPRPQPVVLGVTNAKIDTPTQVEFDYARATACHYLTFKGVFYDKTGKQVDLYVGSGQSVPANKTVHFTVNVSPPLPATAVRFDAIPTCHD